MISLILSINIITHFSQKVKLLFVYSSQRGSTQRAAVLSRIVHFNHQRNYQKGHGLRANIGGCLRRRRHMALKSRCWRRMALKSRLSPISASCGKSAGQWSRSCFGYSLLTYIVKILSEVSYLTAEVAMPMVFLLLRVALPVIMHPPTTAPTTAFRERIELLCYDFSLILSINIILHFSQKVKLLLLILVQD